MRRSSVQGRVLFYQKSIWDLYCGVGWTKRLPPISTARLKLLRVDLIFEFITQVIEWVIQLTVNLILTSTPE